MLANQRKDYDAAEALYKKALALDPSHAGNTNAYASFLFDQRKDRDAAETYYKKALVLDPSDATNTGNYANLQAERGDYDAAEALYKKALELDPGHANNTSNYASFLSNQRQDFDAAEALYKKALELDPAAANTIANFASLLLSKADPASLRQVGPLVRRVVKLCDRKPSQTVAEALLYGCLQRALTSGSADELLARLKGLLALGYARGSLDFAALFDRVLPKLAPERQAFYRALGAAILEADRLADLDAFESWHTALATDPFAPFDAHE